MSDSELTVVAPQSFQPPILIERAGASTRKKFFEFFTVPIRNANTRAAYYRAIQQFLAWAERAGYQHLEDIEPITVAAYIETLQRQAAPPTVKQHMAAIRMLFSWLTEKGVLAMCRLQVNRRPDHFRSRFLHSNRRLNPIFAAKS